MLRDPRRGRDVRHGGGQDLSSRLSGFFHVVRCRPVFRAHPVGLPIPRRFVRDLYFYLPDISRYYSIHRERFWTAVPLNILGWVFGGVEMYFFCRILHVDISVLEAVMLEALLQLIRTGSFFIPGNLGAQEGGLAFFMGQMGFEPVLGVGLSLLKRFRQIVWTAAGFLVWVILKIDLIDSRTKS
jgi:hypothetical protein